MNNKKISTVIIVFLLLLNVAHVYSGTVIISNAAATPAKTYKNSKSDIINNSSFKQISKHMYDACSQVYVNIQKDMFYFTSPVQKNSSIKKFYKVMYFSGKPVEYAIGSPDKITGERSAYTYGGSFLENVSGFNAIFVFVITMFMLFLCALYKGSVPHSAIIINKYKHGIF